MSKSRRFVFVFFTLFIACTLTPTLVQAQSDTAREKILAKANNRPLVSLQDAADLAKNRPVKAGPAREVPNFRSKGKPVFAGGTATSDAILQEEVGQQIAMVGSGFYGSSNNDNADVVGFMIAPPDTDGQVGPGHFVQMINLVTTIFDKSGGILVGPFASDAFWLGIGGNCEAYNQGDPIVLYDDVDDRWLVSQFAFPDSMGSYSQCVAISKNGDPTGGWWRYEFSFVDYGLNDYPKHGIVSNSITMTANLFTKRGRNFNWGGTFLGVMDKAAMYAGDPATLIGYNIGTAEFGFVAGDLDGIGSVPALFATAMTTANRFDIWQLDVDWSTEDASLAQIASVPIAAFDSELCTESRGACIPQPEGGPLLESLSDRLMHRLQIRQFPTHLSMVTAHTVDVGGGRAGIRWYELRETNGTDWELYQQGTFGPADGEYRFMPSAAMNAAGDIGIGYLLSSTNTYVSTAAVGQTFSASGTGVLDSEELICAPGSGVQEEVSRSGDYSSTSIDPIDDSFWHTNEVFTQNGSFQWNTFICEFVVADSGGNLPPAANFSFNCNDLSCDFTDNSSDSDGSVVSWSWGFGDGGTSTDQNPPYTFAIDGDYDVTLLVTDNEGATDSVTQTVTVTGPVVNIPPTASFTYVCTDLSCNFTDNSSDSDGSVVSWSWGFGDGGTSTDQNPPYTFAIDGDYDVTLLVTDNEGATDSVTQTVTVTGPVGNIPPTASFTYVCNDFSCDFDGSGSSDSDGTISSYDWVFGDGSTSSGPITSHTYLTAGDFTVTLTVTDNQGATDMDSQGVSVSIGSELLLVGSSEITSNSRWKATVEDLNGGELHGSWSASGTPWCGGSVCTLSNIHKKVLSIIFTADGTGEQVTIDKP